MAIEIIKPGRREAVRYQATCHKCGCEFSFLATDARWSTDPREGTLLIIGCPTKGCAETIYKDAGRDLR
jgi:hypothetical protein